MFSFQLLSFVALILTFQLLENADLQSFLILPVQRMPRYEMLLKVFILFHYFFQNLTSSSYPFSLTIIHHNSYNYLINQELCANTPTDHPDFNNLTVAIESIVQINKYLNEKKRIADSNQRLIEMETELSGKLVRELIKPNMQLKHEEEVNFKKIRKKERERVKFSN